MAIISMKQLLEAGVHFGHQTRRWNPKMAPYIFTERNGIYIIDLQKTVKKVDEAYNFIREVAADGTFDLLPKKEVIGLKHEMEKLTKYLGGIKDMKKLPGAMFIVDPRKEHIAVLEAHKLNIPIVATVDTNCDPDEIDHVIPANDDAIRAVKLLTAKMADAVLEGRQGMQTEEAAEEAPATEEAE